MKKILLMGAVVVTLCACGTKAVENDTCCSDVTVEEAIENAVEDVAVKVETVADEVEAAAEKVEDAVENAVDEATVRVESVAQEVEAAAEKVEDAVENGKEALETLRK